MNKELFKTGCYIDITEKEDMLKVKNFLFNTNLKWHFDKMPEEPKELPLPRWVEVRDYPNGSWDKRYLLAIIPNAKKPFCCVSSCEDDNELSDFNAPYDTIDWTYMREIEESKTVEITLEEIAKLKGCEVSQIRIKE